MRQRRRLLAIVSVAGLIVIWHTVSLLAGRSPLTNQRLVPTAVDLARSFDDLSSYWPGGLGIDATTSSGNNAFGIGVLALLYNSLATALRLTVGVLLGAVVAVALAAIIGWSDTLRRMFELPSHIVRVLPLLALAPVFNLWFGSTERGAVFFIAFATFATLFVMTLTALANVSGSYVDYARSLGASRARAYLTVVLPAGLPALRAGVLLALGFGWSMALASEFLGQSVGLGNIINRAQEFGQTNTIALVGLFVMVYGALSYVLAARIFDYLIRWAE
jgi:ABC-type nitrate/sulfonate/bicarbonate transport system permease component